MAEEVVEEAEEKHGFAGKIPSKPIVHAVLLAHPTVTD